MLQSLPKYVVSIEIEISAIVIARNLLHRHSKRVSNLFLDKQQECDLPIYGGGGTGDVTQSVTPSTAATTTPVRYK